MTEEIKESSESKVIERDDKGRFKKGATSPNPSGRKKGTKGVKHKFSKAALENMLHKDGLWAFKELRKLAEQAIAKGDLNTAFKCLVTIGDKYYQLTIHNDKVEIQAMKDAEAKKLKAQKESQIEEDGDEAIDYSNVVISFPVASNE